jgi:hypothetical protein
MASYQESTVTGTAWKRCNKIEIRNPYQGQKLAIFLEEELTSLANGKIIQEPSTNIQEPFADPTKIVELVDPTTGTPLGNTVTYQEIYVILHSLYIQLADERDAASIPPTE